MMFLVVIEISIATGILIYPNCTKSKCITKVCNDLKHYLKYI